LAPRANDTANTSPKRTDSYVSRKMDQKIKSLIGRIKAHLTKLYGAQVKKVILYGSCVRGTANSDSDIDILILVDESLNSFEVRESLSDLLYDILLEEGELVSVVVVGERLYESYNSPFMLNVKKEGLVT
jgi:predicted nucleotidyltransferase